MNRDERLFIACGDVPGGVLIDISSTNAIAVKYTLRKFAAAARRDRLQYKIVAQGQTIDGAFAAMLRIWGITATQATKAISRAMPVGEWQTFDFRGA
jgi:hypothetical protein